MNYNISQNDELYLLTGISHRVCIRDSLEPDPDNAGVGRGPKNVVSSLTLPMQNKKHWGIMKKQNILFVIMLMLSFSLNSQIIITGKVIDQETQSPLPWANIKIDGCLLYTSIQIIVKHIRIIRKISLSIFINI